MTQHYRTHATSTRLLPGRTVRAGDLPRLLAGWGNANRRAAALLLEGCTDNPRENARDMGCLTGLPPRTVPVGHEGALATEPACAPNGGQASTPGRDARGTPAANQVLDGWQAGNHLTKPGSPTG